MPGAHKNAKKPRQILKKYFFMFVSLFYCLKSPVSSLFFSLYSCFLLSTFGQGCRQVGGDAYLFLKNRKTCRVDRNGYAFIYSDLTLKPCL